MSEGRRFGLTLGPAFAVLGGLLIWRDKDTVAVVLFWVAAVLIAGAVLFPRQLQPLERAWMAFANLLSRVTTPIFLAVVFFVAITVTGLLMRLLGRNPLVRTEVADSFWVDHAAAGDMKRQF